MDQVFPMDLLPLAMALGEGSEQRAPMDRAVIGGLITSTLLTLFVVPVVYTLLYDLTNRLRRGRAAHAPRVGARRPHRPAVRDPWPVAAD